MYIGTNFPTQFERSKHINQVMRTGVNPYAAMQAAELDYVELSLKRDKFDEVTFRADCRAVLKHELHLAIHPYYGCRGFGTGRENHALRGNLKAVLRIAGEATQSQGRPVVLNFHAASGDARVRHEELVQASVTFNDWLLQTAHDLGAEVIITTEHQLPPPPRRQWTRYGDNFADLMSMYEASQPKAQAPASFGLCWDVGHSTMRHFQYDDPADPPNGFAERVAHVHIHDVEANGPTDHRLIGTGDAPLRTYIALLQEAGYAGGFTMEYDADEWFSADYADFLIRSKQALLALEKPLVV